MPFLPGEHRRRGLPPPAELAVGGLAGVGMAALVGAIPYLAIVAALAIVAGLIATVLAHRRGGDDPVVRQRRTWTLLALPVALAATTAGMFFTVAAIRHRRPELPTTTAIVDECRSVAGTLTIGGTVHNTADRPMRLTVVLEVSFTRNERKAVRAPAGVLGPLAVRRFQLTTPSLAVSPSCRVLFVEGSHAPAEAVDDPVPGSVPTDTAGGG